jgi:putative hydrolase of the HAD superfamily
MSSCNGVGSRTAEQARDASVKLLIWDFDNTLAYREGMWSGALIDVLDSFVPRHQITREQIRPFLRHGFPWHAPDGEHPHLCEAEAWWQTLHPVFALAYQRCGIEPARAEQLARSVRSAYCDQRHWQVFDDAIPALKHLSSAGWAHVILSNHVPELPLLVRELSIQPFITAVFTSAAIGYEKPHPEAFRTVLRAYPHASRVYMIGDNWTADIGGATAAGIPAILVRADHPEARYWCADLTAVAVMLENQVLFRDEHTR